ncbi:LysM peptidoglycan-binding domain-containing protein [Giesbergeria sinuosa]
MHHQKEDMPLSNRTPSGMPWRMVLALGAALTGLSAQAQTPAAISTSTPATTQAVTPPGIAVAELAPNAPDRYVVQRGDTLWGISGMYLQKPWRWPDLWGMNRQEIANPHLIFPGQTLYLDQQGGYARLRTRATQNSAPDTVRLSPRTRSETLADTALPTLKPHLIEPFLAEPLVVDEQELLQAPRIIATTEDRVLMSTGDRVYARGDATNPLRTDTDETRHYRVFRNALPLKHPVTGEVLGYEAQYLGKAELLRGEGSEISTNDRGERIEEYIPATLSITAIREEIRAGDRLLPAPARSFVNYTPHAPQHEIDARVVSIYNSSALANAAQNQVIAISAGEHDGLQTGHVLHLMTKGAHIQDKTDPSRPTLKLPSESNGVAMVFRTFERASYALILNVQTTVRVGDRLVNPQ